MKNLFLLLSTALSLSILVSCDQDENFDDKWISKEAYSLSAKTRSGDIESKPVLMPYIYPGQAEENCCVIKDSLEVDFHISWPGGFNVGTGQLKIEEEKRINENWQCKDFYIHSKSLSNTRATFIFVIKYAKSMKEGAHVYTYSESIAVNVHSEDKDIFQNP